MNDLIEAVSPLRFRRRIQTRTDLCQAPLQLLIDPRIDSWQDFCRPNSGACGYPGARVAEAVIQGKADLSHCVACTPEAKQEIAAALGFTRELPLSLELRKVARLACNGCNNNLTKPYNYKGIRECHVVARCFGSPDKCNYGCLRFASVSTSVPFTRFSRSKRPARDRLRKMYGMRVCVQQCPQKVLYLSNALHKIHIKCNNRAKGKAAMTHCSVSCISCGLCVKKCPTQAITMKEDVNGSLPVIDRDKCIECGLCVKACPRHCIQFLEPIDNEVPTHSNPKTAGTGCEGCAAKETCGMHL